MMTACSSAWPSRLRLRLAACSLCVATALPLTPHLRLRPAQRGNRTAAEVNKLLKERQEQMEHSSLSVKEEKMALMEMKRMKEDAKRYLDWETELDVLKNKRGACTEQLRLAYEQLDEHRAAAFKQEAASQLNLGVDELVELKLGVSEEMQEVLSSLLWRKKLASECSVVIKMDRGSKRGAILAGTAESVASAKALIESVGPVAVHKKVLDDEQQGLLIGKRGATIAQLQDETGCSLEIKKGNSTLTIAGPQASVASTVELIDELLRDQRRVEITLKFDPEQKGTLLGAKGSTINRIQQESSGAQLEVSKGEECTIRVWGPSAAVARARTALVSLLFLDAKSIQVVEVPGELLDHVIGRGGDRVKKLEEEHAVRIDSSRGADRSEPAKLKLRGSIDGVKAAVAAVTATIERERKVEEVLMVESQHIGLLLGKSGGTINAIQRESGAVLDVQKRKGGDGDDKGGAQAVTVRGSNAAVKKAMAALEVVLQYKAECAEEVVVAPSMMPLLIGRSGEEINRIRLETGCAIDGERYDPSKKDEKPTLKLRGSKAAVEKARVLIQVCIDNNKVVSESVVLPWHAVDVLVGANGEKLRELESAHSVGVILPGQDIASDNVGMGSGFVSISTSMTLKGRKKCVDAARDYIEKMARENYVEELGLSTADGDLLASMCLRDEALLDGLMAKWKVTLDLDARAGVLSVRGEGSVEAQREIKTMLANERFAEEIVACGATQFDYLMAEGPHGLPHLSQLCAPAMVAVQEGGAPAVAIFARGSQLPDAVALATQWVADHARSEEAQSVPPEVVGLIKAQLPARQVEWRVQLLLVDGSTECSRKGACTLRLAGPLKFVKSAAEAAAALVRAHAHVEERLVLSAGAYALVSVLLQRRSHSPHLNGAASGAAAKPANGAGGKPTSAAAAAAGGKPASAAAAAAAKPSSAAAAAAAGGKPASAAAAPPPAGLFENVETMLEASASRVQAAGGDGKSAPSLGDSEGQLVLRGTAAPVARVKASVEAVLAEAETGAQTTPATPAQISRLTARNPRTGETLLGRLQLSHQCALIVERDAGTLQVYGSGEAVARVMTALETELDVDEHVREVNDRMIPIIIGRGGTNIKKLNTDSGATIDLDRFTKKLTVRGRKAQVAKAVALLDAIVGDLGVEESMAVPARQLGTLIGRGGATIKQLQQDSGATIDIRKEENLVKVRGSKEAVEKAMTLIRETLAGGGGGGAPPGLAPKITAPPPGLAADGAPPGLS